MIRPWQRLRQWRRKQNFEPGAVGWLVNPFFFARRGLLKELKEFFPLLQGDLLDVGCGEKPYRAYVPAQNYIGLENDSLLARSRGAADVYYDGKIFPFSDGRFDAVFCSQVLEHVFNPVEFLAEIKRVVRPGGYLVLTVPFAWDEHEQPYDFARYSSFGLSALLERNGFKIEGLKKSTADSRALFQLVNAYLFKVTRTRFWVANAVAQFGLMAPINLVGIVVGWVLPANPDFYLDNIVLARRDGP